MAVTKKSITESLPLNFYGWIHRYRREKINSEIEKQLARLYPGENAKRKYREYQGQKYLAMMTVIVIGIAAAVCMHLSSRMQDRLSEGTRLYRNEWGEGNYSVTLSAQTARGKAELDYEVKERLFSEKEIEELKNRAFEALPEAIIGKNENLLSVKTDLNLVTGLKGYPFTITWQSSDYERVRTDGKVLTDGIELSKETVILTAVFTYGEKHWKQDIYVTLVPPDLQPQQQYLNSIRQLLAECDKLFEESSEIVLPDKIDDEIIVWKEKKQNSGCVLVLTGIMGAALIAWGMKRDLQQKTRQRNEEIIRFYPEFVCKLQLYMGAGMTVKNAFIKIGRDYQKDKGKTGKKIYLYEEVLISNYQLLNGMPEGDVFREWGKRCMEIHCRKLGFLLASHLKRGNDKIFSLLSEERDLSIEERKNRVRKQGEEAGTRLLFPMLIMLIVVMFLILLPAFNSFGSI